MAEKKEKLRGIPEEAGEDFHQPESRGYHPGRCDKTIRRGDTLL